MLLKRPPAAFGGVGMRCTCPLATEVAGHFFALLERRMSLVKVDSLSLTPFAPSDFRVCTGANFKC